MTNDRTLSMTGGRTADACGIVVDVKQTSEWSCDRIGRAEDERPGTGFPGLLRQHRVGARLTQEQLAERAGLNVRSVSQLERGRVRYPRPETVRLLARALNLTAIEMERFHLLARVDYWADRDPEAGRETNASDAESGSGATDAAGSTPSGRSDGERPVPAHLPGDVVAFTGRTAELSELDTMLAATSHDRARHAPQAGPTAIVISAVSGTAGVGKTALALHWAHRVAARFPDGQLYVNLRGYDPDRPMDPGEAIARFLRALGVTDDGIPAGLDERAARYRTELAGRRILIVLDNAAAVEQVRPLLPGTPSAMVVVTSRDSLAGLVALHGARRLDLDLLPLEDACALLRRLVGRRIAGDSTATAALAGQCSRLPLALRVAAELAAERATSSIAELVTELADERRRLELLDAGGDPRAAVDAVFSWSYRHLSLEGGRLYRLLGLHPGVEFDAHAASALTGRGVEDVRRLLAALARTHLITPVGPCRYGMHDLLRIYAAGLAAAQDSANDRRAALGGLFDYYLAAAAAAMDRLYPADTHRRPRLPPPVPAPCLTTAAAARTWLDTEGPNLTAVAAHTAANGWPAHTIRFSATLFRHLLLGHSSVALTIHAHARDAARTIGDRAGAVHALTSLGVAHARTGQRDRAAALLRQALVECRQIDDEAGTARVLSNLAGVEYQLGHYSVALHHLKESAEMAHRRDDRMAESEALTNLARVEHQLGRYEAAADHLGRALALVRSSGEIFSQVQMLINLGLVNYGRGRHAQAAQDHDEALQLARQSGNRSGEAYSLVGLGDVELQLAQPAHATEHYTRALTISREVGDRDCEAWALNGLAETALAAGRPEQALERLNAALTLATGIGNRSQQARAHECLGRAREVLGDPETARTDRQQAQHLYASLGMPEADRIRQLPTSGRDRRGRRS